MSSPYYTHFTKNVNGNCAQYQMTGEEPAFLGLTPDRAEAAPGKREKSLFCDSLPQNGRFVQFTLIYPARMVYQPSMVSCTAP